MKHSELLTAPLGTASAILSITVPNLDEVEAIVMLFTAVFCGLRSAWIVAKPALLKIRDAWRAYKERKKGGDDNEKVG